MCSMIRPCPDSSPWVRADERPADVQSMWLVTRAAMDSSSTILAADTRLALDMEHGSIWTPFVDQMDTFQMRALSLVYHLNSGRTQTKTNMSKHFLPYFTISKANKKKIIILNENNFKKIYKNILKSIEPNGIILKFWQILK